jgi:DNA-binding GntR family transcriptional regulator
MTHAFDISVRISDILTTPPASAHRLNLATTTMPSHTERVIAAVERDILSGALMPGDAIDDRALAHTHGVSRTPVREALLLLAAQGLVEIVPRVGIRVYRPSAAELVALVEALAELEAACTGLAAQRMDPAAREALQQAQRAGAAHAAAADRAGYAEANECFHGLIWAASANPVLVGQLAMVRKRLAAFRRRVLDQPGRLPVASAEHAQIVQAVLAGRAEEAARAMRSHVLRKGQAVAEVVLAAAD